MSKDLEIIFNFAVISRWWRNAVESVLECRPELEKLFRGLSGVEKTISLGDPFPEFDIHLPLMSLPHVFRTNLQNLPAKVPYLKTPHGCSGDPRIEAVQGFKVGITWSGSATRVDNHRRSLKLSKLEPIFELRRKLLQFASR